MVTVEAGVPRGKAEGALGAVGPAGPAHRNETVLPLTLAQTLNLFGNQLPEGKIKG